MDTPTHTLLAKDDGLYLALTDRKGRQALIKLRDIAQAEIAAAVIQDTWEALREAEQKP